MKDFGFYLAAAISVFLLIPVRSVLVHDLRRKRPDLWLEFGSPSVFERDNVMKKYPYRGGRAFYRVSDRLDRLLLWVYVFLHAAFVFSAGMTLITW